MKRTHLYLLCIAIFLMFVSCSRTRNTFVSRSYHNLTAHYNAYFNGREAFKQGTKKIDNTIKDDFTTIIPVYPVSNSTAAKSASSNMETALAKSAKVIKLHSITARPKRKSGNLSKKKKEFYNKTEYCNWIDDSWLLTGKSKFVNHDWYGAEEAFEYIIKEYSNQPVKYEASIWLARTYNEMNKFSDSKNILDRMEGEKEFPKKLIQDLTLAYADLYLKEKKYQDAIPKLRKAISLTKKKKERARYYFILGQLYQKFNQYTNALECYSTVIKYNPPYDMVFNAQINRATCFDMGSGSAEQIRKQLNKMLKNDKNIEYQDQIYYALANIYMKEGQTEKALDNYKQSVKASMGNSAQKAQSYLAIADIYFNQQKYIPCQAYYDSTITFLDQKHPDYEAIEAKSRNLSELVTNLIIIQTEDSLQRVALLPEKERNKLIDGIIEEIIKEEERKKHEDQQQQINSMLFQQNQQNQFFNQNTGGKWYFYNPSTLSFGLSEFKKKWGNRKLEDDWRRKNKTIITVTVDSDTAAATDSMASPAITNNKKREYYLQNLPLNDTLIALSNKRIEEAYFNSSEAYVNKLKNYRKAAVQFETLVTRFPSSKFLLQAYYELYNIYVFLEDKAQAEKYKNLIIQKFPLSNYASVLSNPNYLNEMAEKREKVNQLYDAAYREFKNRNYFSVFSYCNVADSLYSGNYISAKFGLLKALSVGGTGDFHSFKTSLNNVIEKYPGTEEKNTAENILAYVSIGDYSYLAQQQQFTGLSQKDNLSEKKDTAKTDSLAITEESDYSADEKDKNYFVILLDKNADIYKLKYNLFGYNIDYFSMFDFEISTGTWNERYQLIKVQSFSSLKDAVKYYKSTVKHKETVYRNIDERQYKSFVISESNITKLQADMDIDKYIDFFTRKILKK